MGKPIKDIQNSRTTQRQVAGAGMTGGLGALVFAIWESYSPETAPGPDVRNIVIAALAALLGPFLSRWFAQGDKVNG